MSCEQEYILYKKHKRVATLTLNRPEKLNALNPELLSQLKQMMISLEEEGEVRAIVLRGAGDRAFSAGFDVTRFDTVFPRGNVEDSKRRLEQHPVAVAVDAVASFPYPVIAMINGYAFGGGLELTMACDLRIAVESAKMGMPPAKIGIVYRSQGLRYFINAVGMAYTKEIFLLGRMYDAFRAKEMGLVHYVIPENQLVDFTFEMARELSENAPLAVRGVKAILSKMGSVCQLSTEDEAWAMGLVAEAYNSEDMAEGLTARKEKRKPKFKGR